VDDYGSYEQCHRIYSWRQPGGDLTGWRLDHETSFIGVGRMEETAFLVRSEAIPSIRSIALPHACSARCPLRRPKPVSPWVRRERSGPPWMRVACRSRRRRVRL